MWIDSHCHLNHERFENLAPLEIAQHALGQGVDALLTVCCRISEELPQLLEIANAHDHIWCSVGTHPHDADHPQEVEITQKQLVQMTRSDPKIIAIGETGLDYFYDNAPRQAQQDSFRKHIRACLETKLPLIVHTRDADEDIFRIIKEEGAGTDLRGVMHCFSSGPDLAEKALDFGFYLSFSGIVTFKKAQELQVIAVRTPLDRILVETDAPFLAPVPHRGKINRPEYVAHTGTFLAELRGENVSDFAAQTSQNFFTLFNQAKR